MRPDLTERLLRLGAAERELLKDLHQARFATRLQAEALAALGGGSLAGLLAGGLAREVTLEEETIVYLGQSGVRAALALLGDERASGARAYAALRLGHELRRTELYLALRRVGMPACAYAAEPRLDYRSAAGLGGRTLVPDALVLGQGGAALIEVDRGTEGSGQLRHKWLRYREWQEDGPRRALYVLAQERSRVEATLQAAGLDATVLCEPEGLARLIWSQRPVASA